MTGVTRDQLKRYRDVIAMWMSRFDTCSIADHTGLPESLVVRWTANFQDLKNGGAAA